MNTLRTYNTARVDWLSRDEQKKRIREYWGARFVRFHSGADKRYIVFSVRI